MHNYFRNGDRSGVIDAMKNYFHFSKRAKFLSREDYTPEQWEKIVKSELSHGRPLITEGWGSIDSYGNHDGHWFFCDGYNAENLYHIRWDYGESVNEYCPLYKFGGYSGYNWMFVYLEPEKNGKELELTSPVGSEIWKPGTKQTITWNSLGVNSIKIEYSTNNGYDYTTVASGVEAALGSYQFTIPNDLSASCKIRITDESDINIYSRNKIPFSSTENKDLTVKFTVDMNYQISEGIFKPATDKVFLKGSFNGWGDQNPISLESNGVYTCTLVLDPSTSYEYKYFINSAGAENGGWEMNISDGENGNRVVKTGTSPIVLPNDYFNNRRVSAKELREEFMVKNYPNPFNESTDFLFTVSSGVHVSIKVFDILGKEVANVVDENFQPGIYQKNWDASGLKGGIYLYKMQAGEFSTTRQLVVIR